ncbi:MAG TPA: DUF4168 domain-containing protein [Membranihabitans sp.]|nr:DUF4168 domain-containing protein [Membranihabitans sp.]
MRYLSIIIALLLLGIVGMQAQVTAPEQPRILESEEVSDQEVEQFVTALQEAQKVQQESQPKMIKAIEDEGLNTQQFVQAAQAMQQEGESGLNEEDQKKFDKVQEKVMKIQEEANEEIENKIQENNLTLEKFNQIYLSFQQKPALQKRIQDRLGMPSGQ